MIPARLPQPTERRRSTSSGTSGSATRCSTAQKAASRTTPSPSASSARRVGPRVLAGRGESVDDGQQPRGDAERAGHVQPGPLGRPALGQHRRADHQDGERDDDVDVERPAPAQQVGEHAAEHRAGGEAGRHQRAVEAERPLPARALGEGRGQQRQRGRRDDRGRGALRDPGDEQHPGCGGEPADQRGDAEQRDAGQEQPAAPEQVRDPAEEQREAGGAERERGRDPLQVLQREPDVGADVRAGRR